MLNNPNIAGFEWDIGNAGKNLMKHGVTDGECEEPFFDPRRKILKDALHSGGEKRFLLFGKTEQRRLLCVSFTIRRNRIRVISARDANRKEKPLYEKEA
ncbi:MAG: BrnT family toxin [Parcubacteria group bacterium]|nr:BrnT family toxin [Parcubacteria group bacterium]